MATVTSFLEDLRYDLNDFGALEYSDTALIKYLNRALYLLNHELSRTDSHWVLESDDVTLSSGSNSATIPTGCNTIKQIWYDNELLQKKTPHWIFSYREAIGRTETGEPRYWAQHQGTAIFDYVADDDYTLRFIYSKNAADLTSTDDMPFSSQYDDLLRQGTLVIARAAKDNKISNTDVIIKGMFQTAMDRQAIIAHHDKPKYHLDF